MLGPIIIGGLFILASIIIFVGWIRGEADLDSFFIIFGIGAVILLMGLLIRGKAKKKDISIPVSSGEDLDKVEKLDEDK
jgi:hypothetical protein